MPTEACIMGLFKDEGKAAKAIAELAAAGFSFRRTHSPYPAIRSWTHSS